MGNRRAHFGSTWARPVDVRRDSLVLPNRKNPSRTVKRVFLAGADLGLTGKLLLWAKEQSLADEEPLFFSRKRSVEGTRRPLQRGQAWLIVKQASERARVQVLALRASKHGRPGDPAPVHPHIFRHACARSCLRREIYRSPNAKAGWSWLQMAYLTVGATRHADSCKS